MLFTPIDVSAVVGGGAPTLGTEKDCILTEYLAWHAGATIVYNYGLWASAIFHWKSSIKNFSPSESLI